MTREPTANTAIQSGDAKRPVILQVLPALETGGVERTTVDVAAAIVEAGARAIVASSGGPMTRELERIGAEHIELPLHTKSPLGIRRNIGRLSEVIKSHSVDIVHARSRAPAWSALAAARQNNCHFVTTFHGTYSHGNPIKRRHNAIMLRGDRVIANSAFTGEHISSVYKSFDTSRLRIIPRGVDLERFDPERVSAERVIQLTNAWRIPDGMPVIMLPGRLTDWKGHKILIEALTRMKNAPVRCLIVGDAQGRERYQEDLKELVKAKGLESVVHFVGECRDMPAALKLADVVVSASTKPEAFGRVAAEAQAMGRPIVATNHGGSRETVLDRRTGWLVPVKDPDAMARAIDAAIGLNTADREQVAKLATTHIRKNFSKELMCRRTLQVYNELLFGNAPENIESVEP